MLALDLNPRSVQIARAEAHALCLRQGVDQERSAAVAVVVSELVGNAIRHAQPPVTFDLVVDDEGLLVVVDDGDERPPDTRPALPPQDREGGRGMFLIATLARCWGWQPLSCGKRVWARL